MNTLINKTEQYRHQCEVRQLILWTVEDGNWDRIQKYFNNPKVFPRVEQLKEDVKTQFKKGNRGRKGEWLE